MLTGELRSQVDQIWNAFWSGGVSNPLSEIEQINYILFIKRLHDLQTLEENKANVLYSPLELRLFQAESDKRGYRCSDLSRSRWRDFRPREMMDAAAKCVFLKLSIKDERTDLGCGSDKSRIGA